MKQKIFLKEYTDELFQKVKQNDISAYHIDKFDYNDEATFEINTEATNNLLDYLMQHATPKGDYEAAIALYEAFPNLTREQACYKPFWAYLTHVDLYPYMIKRFCNGQRPTEKDIKNNWWHNNLMRNGLSNLWWSVNQTIDENNSTNRYLYTKYLFLHLDYRQRRLGSSTLFRHKEAVIGILKFLMENITQYFEGRSNFIIMYLNKQATLRQLTVLKRDDFYNELQNIKTDILKVQYRTEAAEAVNNQDISNWDDEFYD